MRFEAKMDDLSKAVTFVVMGVLIIPTVLIINTAAHGHPETLFVIAFVIITLALAALWRVKAYELDGGTLSVIRAGVKPARFPLQDLATATPVTKKELGFGIRVFGSGGYFGYFGEFAYRKLGRVRMYVTDRSKLVLLQTKTGKNIIVSPVDTEGFLKALRLPVAQLD